LSLLRAILESRRHSRASVRERSSKYSKVRALFIKDKKTDVVTDHCISSAKRIGKYTGFSFPLSHISVSKSHHDEYQVDVGTPHRVKLVSCLMDDKIVQEGLDVSHGGHAGPTSFFTNLCGIRQKSEILHSDFGSKVPEGGFDPLPSIGWEAKTLGAKRRISSASASITGRCRSLLH
jgi:hypothetical protein